MAILIVFVLGIVNFAAHRAVLESGHSLVEAMPRLFQRLGGRVSLVVEFVMLVGAMWMVSAGSDAWAFGYIGYSAMNALAAWLPFVRRNGGSYLFPSRRKTSRHLSTRQYARIVHRWVASIGLETNAYGTHSMRRTKAAQIYKKTGNLRAVQILLGHTKLESTVRYLGVEVDDALRIAEQIEL